VNKIEFKAVRSIFELLFIWVLLIRIPLLCILNLSKNLYTHKRLYYPDSSVSPDPMKVLSNALAFDLIAFVSGSSQRCQFVPASEKPNDERQLDSIWHRL
jgi:hypothetical protein